MILGKVLIHEMYLISDNVDTWTGMRLAGVEGCQVVHGKMSLGRNLIRLWPIKRLASFFFTEGFGRRFPELVKQSKS